MPETEAKVRPVVGLQIKQARQQRQWSQAKLAHMLNRATGFRSTITAKYVSKWERGERNPGYEWGRVIERVLDLDLAARQTTTEEISLSARGGSRLTPTGSDTTGGCSTATDPESDAARRGQYTEREHLDKALQDAGRYLDESIIEHFRRQLDDCMLYDGTNGPTSVLPVALSTIGVVEHYARQVKPNVRQQLLSLGARGAEFAGWLYRDAYRPDRALYWRDRAVEWAQEAGDWEMQGYILLKKSQSAWDERDGLRMLTLAQAAHNGPWQLSPLVRAETAQQEARGLAMVGESSDSIYRKLDQAWELFDSAGSRDRETNKLGRHYNKSLLTMQCAICHCEAGRPLKAVETYQTLLSQEQFSYRDRGYFLSLMASALASAKEVSSAVEVGQKAMEVARQTKSQRTVNELERVCQLLDPWRAQSSVRELRSAVRAASARRPIAPPAR
ncbi:helix-turn-helix domain-containing protein [Pseudonocardia acaciae]|uniref:helix-turn-helix domain-containing protein n=1 Tax=Pseudonocardia acaciae TaxID=551276 RepID=UPI00146FF063|nr:helix-turn-helix transcriptional regulator [Pseudonocardia acaciae]